MGLTKIEYEDNYIEVYNKIDLLDLNEREFLKEKNKINGVGVSGLTGEGCDEVLNLLRLKFEKKTFIEDVVLDMSDGKGLAKIYKENDVIERKDDIKKQKIYLKIKYNKK